MSDQQKTPGEDDQQPEDPTPTAEQATAEQPAAEEAPAGQAAAEQPPAPAASTGRTRKTLIASGAGLALVGGLIGFGIGQATAGDGDDRFGHVGQHAPGEGRPGLREGHRPDRPFEGERDKRFRNGDSEQPSRDS